MPISLKPEVKIKPSKVYSFDYNNKEIVDIIFDKLQ